MICAIALVLLVLDKYTISTFLSAKAGRWLPEARCALEQPDRRLNMTVINNPSAFILFIGLCFVIA
jgi:hypothetical protein